MSTSGDSLSAAAGAASADVMTLTTPGGNPTWSMISASSITASGSWSAGFITTVQPAANAGAILPAMLTSGKLYGVMQATTPTGARFTMLLMSPPAARGGAAVANGASAMSCDRTAALAYQRKRSIATGTCM